VRAAHEENDGVRLVEIAWVRCGSWDLPAITAELEALCRQTWGSMWDVPLWDLGLHTTKRVEAAIREAQRRQHGE
jgi:hypothetical protein